VTFDKLAPGALRTFHFTEGAVTEEAIAPEAVTSERIRAKGIGRRICRKERSRPGTWRKTA